MSSTHLSLHYHLIWSTKIQKPLMHAEWRSRLHAYLGGIARELRAIPEVVNGVEDHVHLLVGLRATHCLADVLRDLKRASSGWVHDTIGMREFEWQDGYGAFTVSPSLRKTVLDYIAGQEEHHRKKTFKEEYVEFLEKSGVEYDPKYLW